MRKKIRYSNVHVFTQTEENKAFQASLYKAIVDTASCVDDVEMYKKGKGSFLKKIRLIMNLKPNPESYRKISRTYERTTKCMVIKHFEDLLAAKTVDNRSDNTDTSVPSFVKERKQSVTQFVSQI